MTATANRPGRRPAAAAKTIARHTGDGAAIATGAAIRHGRTAVAIVWLFGTANLSRWETAIAAIAMAIIVPGAAIALAAATIALAAAHPIRAAIITAAAIAALAATGWRHARRHGVVIHDPGDIRQGVRVATFEEYRQENGAAKVDDRQSRHALPANEQIEAGLVAGGIIKADAATPARPVFATPSPTVVDGVAWRTVVTLPAGGNGAAMATAKVRAAIASVLQVATETITVDARHGHAGQAAITGLLIAPWTRQPDHPLPAINPAGVWRPVTIGYDATGAAITVTPMSEDDGIGSVAVVGRQGSGKTYMMAALIEQLVAGGGRVAIIDPKLTALLAKFRPVADRYVADVDMAATANGAAATLAWAASEIKRRQDVMRAHGVDGVSPAFAAAHDMAPMWIVVDEWPALDEIDGLADAMIQVLQLGRSSGVGLIIGSQDWAADRIRTAARGAFRWCIALKHRSKQIGPQVLGDEAVDAGCDVTTLPGHGRFHGLLDNDYVTGQCPDVVGRLSVTVDAVANARPARPELTAEPVDDGPTVVDEAVEVWPEDRPTLHIAELHDLMASRWLHWQDQAPRDLSRAMRDAGQPTRSVWSPDVGRNRQGWRLDDLTQARTQAAQ